MLSVLLNPKASQLLKQGDALLGAPVQEIPDCRGHLFGAKGDSVTFDI